jgi:hypothetical protein
MGWLAEVAQVVEHVTENHGVGSSTLPLGTRLNQRRRAASSHKREPPGPQARGFHALVE